MIKKLYNFFTDRTFVLYAIIGLSGVVLDFLFYALLVKLGVPAVLASAVSVSVGIVNNFFWNAHYNFKRKDHLLSRFWRFYAIGATGVVLSMLFILLFHNIFGISALYAKAISVPFIVVFQYWFNKNASFAVDHRQVPWKPLLLFAVCTAVLCLFVVNAPYFNFTDEADNLLGAQLIAQGHTVIYRDYFSHHMPLTYFVGAPLFWIFGTKLVAIKVAFGLAMGSWLLLMSRHLYKRYGMLVFATFTLLVAGSQMLSWSNMLLAETLIAFALCHALILFITRADRPHVSSDLIVFALLGAVPVLSSLSYAAVSLLIYGLLLVRILEIKATAGQKISRVLVAGLVALIPYLLFLGYLHATHTLGLMKHDALNFNTLYYSRFTPDAAISPTDGILSVIQGSVGSLYSVLTFANTAHPQILGFAFLLSIVMGIIALGRTRYYLEAGALTLGLLLGADRNGFNFFFLNNDQVRASIIPTLVGLLVLALAVFHIARANKADTFRRYAAPLALVTITLITFSSVGQIASASRAYLRGGSLVASPQEPGSPSTVINLVNKSSDYYWLGPIDFSSQILIHSKNVSAYRFYAPWHAVCPDCTAQLEKDIASHKPNVIAFDNSVNIWGYKAGTYAQPLIDTFKSDYYQLPDPRLKNFYFRKDRAAEDNKILKQTGYEL